jgi:hypothetical protein
MSYNSLANDDFERAFVKGFWRKVVRWLTGRSNDLLLPYDAVKERLPFKGQHYLGFCEVPIDQIVGSVGRYRDFDRAFLPLQKQTKERWVSIDRAHYESVSLPAVELYKVGEVFFVLDGNHRISVARERGHEFVDAFVTEVDISIPLTAVTDLADLELKGEYARFIENTQINRYRPDADLTLTLPGEYKRLLEHISVHRWYLGEQRNSEVPYQEAVISWYDNVYSPLARIIQQQNLINHFPKRTIADLYIWIIEYQWYRREAYKEDYAFEDAADQFIDDFEEWPAGKLVDVLKQAAWVDYFIIEQERTGFMARTHLADLWPQSDIRLTVPGMYEKLIQHIDVHRWYLGEQKKGEVPYQDAVISWYENVYMPLVEIIRVQGVMDEFPGRTEADLYLWIMMHNANLKELYANE